MEHLVKYNGVFYVPIAVIPDESRRWVKAPWLSKCAKAKNVLSFSGQGIGVPTPKRPSTGEPVGGRTGKYYILDEWFTRLSPGTAAEARLFVDIQRSRSCCGCRSWQGTCRRGCANFTGFHTDSTVLHTLLFLSRPPHALSPSPEHILQSIGRTSLII